MFDVSPFLIPERRAFVELLRGLEASQWTAATECPQWDVKGIALHVLGDDLSLLSRQRDAATNGLIFYAVDHPGQTFPELLDGFNEQWVRATQFLSPELLVELLTLTGTWTADYYGSADPEALGEPVGMFGSMGDPSPNWHAHAREYVERWVHHSQIRRALGLPPIDDDLTAAAIEAVALALGSRTPDLGSFTVGDRTWDFRDGEAVSLDPTLAPVVLSLGLPIDAARAAYEGEPDVVESIAVFTCLDSRDVRTARGITP